MSISEKKVFRSAKTLTLSKGQILLGRFVLVRDLAMITKQLLVHRSPTVSGFLKKHSPVAKHVKIHDEYCLLNPNLGDWGEAYVLPNQK